jgi:hypothetical protein
MTRRRWGAVLAVVGVVLAGFGVVDLIEGDGEVSATTTATTPAAAPTTTSTTSTTAAPSTTTTLAATTTSVLGTGDVEAFVASYRAALDDDDVAFLVNRLHPAVKSGYGEELCNAWVEREIAHLGDYELTGPLAGPRTETFVMGTGSFEVTDVFSGPISFTFQGSSFDGQADFAVLDGVIYWLGVCR